jgi:hypothetical protein
VADPQIDSLDAVQHPTVCRCPENLSSLVAVIAERSAERIDGSVSEIIDYAQWWTRVAVYFVCPQKSQVIRFPSGFSDEIAH